jgi:hypothetical protein
VSAARDFSTRRRPRGSGRADVFLLAAGVLLMAAAGGAAGSAWTDLRRARTRLEDVRRETAEAEARAKTLAAAGPEGMMGARAVWSLEAPPPAVVSAIARALPPDVRLDALALRYGGDLEVEMNVTARTPAAYDAFLEALAGSGDFAAVSPGEESRVDAVRASVRARYGGAAP